MYNAENVEFKFSRLRRHLKGFFLTDTQSPEIIDFEIIFALSE